jgi:hypothetical protein
MLSTAELLNYSKWFGLLTLVCGGITVLGFIFKWGIRFSIGGGDSVYGGVNGGSVGFRLRTV